jgi:hypothetical protein
MSDIGFPNNIHK